MNSTLQLVTDRNNETCEVLCKILAFPFYPQPHRLTVKPLFSRYEGSEFRWPGVDPVKNKQPYPSESVPTVALPRALSPALLDSILGKAPLRLIAARIPTLDDPHLFLETLECGHQVHSFQDFAWTPRLEWQPMKSMRRRCRECKAAAQKFSPKSASESKPPSVERKDSLAQSPERKRA